MLWLHGKKVRGNKMKVLKDNFSKTKIQQIEANTYPRKTLCEHCSSELEYEKNDIRVGAFGCAYIDCPLCGGEICLYDESDNELTLTRYNIEFPTHFWHTCSERGAVDCCNNKEIKECISRAIDYFRKNKDDYNWFTACGNLYVNVSRYESDESYDIVVTKDYYETSIPFEEEDYS